MKYSIKLLNRSITVLLMAVCLFSMAVSAVAANTTTAPEDARYGIIIECSYSDIDNSDTVDRSIYEENIFLLSSKTSELYAIAEYNEEKQTYAVTEYTADQDKATQFHCGSDAKLRINGIVPDTYILDQIQTSTGYTLIFDTELDFSSNTARVNGSEMDTSIDPDTRELIAFLPITLAKGFDIPMGEPDPLSWSCKLLGFNIFLADIILAVGCTLILGSSITLIFVCRAQKKKSPEHH